MKKTQTFPTLKWPGLVAAAAVFVLLLVCMSEQQRRAERTKSRAVELRVIDPGADQPRTVVLPEPDPHE